MTLVEELKELSKNPPKDYLPAWKRTEWHYNHIIDCMKCRAVQGFNEIYISEYVLDCSTEEEKYALKKAIDLILSQNKEISCVCEKENIVSSKYKREHPEYKEPVEYILTWS